MKRQKTQDPDIVKYPNGKLYFRRGNKEISLKTTDFKEATQRKKIILAKSDVFLMSSLALTVSKIYPEYKEHRAHEFKTGKIRARTINENAYLMEKYILPYFGKKKIAKITSLDWAEFAKSRDMDFSNLRKTFSHFTKWAAANGYRSTLLILNIDKRERRPRRILKPQEISAIWQNAHGSLKLFVALALSMGLRRSEIMTLSWDRVSFGERSLFLPKGITKTKKERWVPMPTGVVDLLMTRLTEQKVAVIKTPWVFPHLMRPKEHADLGGLKTAWNTCLRKAFGLTDGRLENITWHDLRATCEYYAHKRSDLTATQLEKFFGASVDVQRKLYVSMDADDLRGVENSLLLPIVSEKSRGMGKHRGEKEE